MAERDAVAPVSGDLPETPLPSPARQAWGVVISIVIIMLMIIIGAFYAWGKRVAQGQYPATASSSAS
ncbi:MAG TPA: hypothetical protein VMV50_00465 [Candidatus Paceibacterota bacterium]|nr:hypothetical protein [Candidatus Paceibacterota bacterium]